MKKLVVFVCVLAVSSVLAGCNTARGFGADLEVLGKSMKNAGKKDKDAEVPETAPPAETTSYPTEDSAYSQPYQDPSYGQSVDEAPTATTYPVEQGQSYPEYK